MLEIACIAYGLIGVVVMVGICIRERQGVGGTVVYSVGLALVWPLVLMLSAAEAMEKN